MRTYLKVLSLLALGVGFGVVIWFGSFGQTTRASQQGPNQQGPKRPILSKLPPIKNCVEHAKLVKAELVMQGDNQAAALEIENIAYIGIVSISVEQIANKTKNGVTKSGFTPDKPPSVVIAPGESKTITLTLEWNTPLRIGAAIFSDGTEEGCAASLKTIHEVRAHDTNGRPQQ